MPDSHLGLAIKRDSGSIAEYLLAAMTERKQASVYACRRQFAGSFARLQAVAATPGQTSSVSGNDIPA